MECPSCAASNAQEARFCNRCGKSLGRGDATISETKEDIIAELKEFVKTQFKDQRLLDIETTELVVGRVQNWAKLFGFFVGVPLFLIFGWLGLLGYQKYADFAASIDRVEAKVKPQLDGVQAEVNAIQARATELRTSLDAAAKLSPQVHDLSSKVDRLEQQIVQFGHSGELTSDKEKVIRLSLASFRQYLSSIGLNPPGRVPTVNVDDANPTATGYASSTDTIEIGSSLLDRPQEALWAYARYVLRGSAPPSSDEYLGMVLAHYYSYSFSGSYHPVSLDSFGHPQNDWLSLFWAIRDSIGKEAADRLFLTLLKTAGSRNNQSVDEYMTGLLGSAARQYHGGGYYAAIQAVAAGKHVQL